MADPTVVVSEKGSGLTDVTSMTLTAMTGSGTDRGLIVFVHAGDDSGDSAAPNAVKWGGSGGTGLTKIYDAEVYAGYTRLTVWYLVAPATGSNQVYVSWAVAKNLRAVTAVYMQDTKQSAPTLYLGTGTTSTTITVNATTASGNLVVDGAAFARLAGSQTVTVGAGQASLQEVEGAAFFYGGLATSSEGATGSSVTMSWTLNTAGDNWRTQAAVFEPVAAGSTTRGTPFGHRGTAFNGGRPLHGIIQ